MLDRTSGFGIVVCLVALTACGIAGAAEIPSGSSWPLLTMRQMTATSQDPETMAELIRIHARHPGGCDEMWLAEGVAFLTAESNVVTRARTLAAYRPALDAAGIVAGFQQGFTLGHGAGLGFSRGREIGFPETAGQVDAQGRRMGLVCPNSPEALAEEERFAENVVREGCLESFWLDDDLRFGFKSWGACCWCDRCLRLLNARCGTSYTREQFVARLSSTNETDEIRVKWAAFKAESLAKFAAAARRGAKRANPNCRMGYQAISSATIASGENFRPVLAALSDGFRDVVGIRPGHGYYAEAEGVPALLAKLLDAAREAERCRRIPGWKGTVAYEQENFPHYAVYKSPEAVLKECALALAVGCDAVTMYWYDVRYPEPLSHYEELVAGAAAWRPYFERLAAIAQKTHLGGVAHRADPKLMTGVKNTYPKTVEHGFPRRNERDCHLAFAGVPVTVAESGTACFYDPEDAVKWGHLLDADRVRLLDKFDTQPGGPVCVRVDKTHRLYVFPRVDDSGRTVSVTFFNVSMGAATSLPVRIRRPAGHAATLVRPCRSDLALDLRQGEGDELRFVLPELPAYALATVILKE